MKISLGTYFALLSIKQDYSGLLNLASDDMTKDLIGGIEAKELTNVLNTFFEIKEKKTILESLEGIEKYDEAKYIEIIENNIDSGDDSVRERFLLQLFTRFSLYDYNRSIETFENMQDIIDFAKKKVY